MSIKHWVVSALSIFIVAHIIPGVTVTLVGALILSCVLGFLNTCIKPIIFILTLPITIVTLGLFSLVINASMILLAAKIVPGFSIPSFWSAFIFSLTLSFVNALFGQKRPHI